jgi:hypothetical protein
MQRRYNLAARKPVPFDHGMLRYKTTWAPNQPSAGFATRVCKKSSKA